MIGKYKTSNCECWGFTEQEQEELEKVFKDLELDAPDKRCRHWKQLSPEPYVYSTAGTIVSGELL